MKQYVLSNGLPQTVRTDKDSQIIDFCKSFNIEIVYGTVHIHTPTGLVGRGIKTLKDYLRTNREGYDINEALNRSINILITTVQSSIKETPFERHYGRKPRTEIHNYLNISP